MMKTNFILAGLLFFVVTSKSEPTTAVPAAKTPAVKTYAVRGIVQQISPDLHTATIKHEAIPEYMAPMTMDFKVRDTNVLTGITPNDEITFKLAVTADDDWIEDVHFVAHHIGQVTNRVVRIRAASEELKLGDTLPDYEFTSEDGRPVRFSDYRGRAVAFTFFFTSCPLPDFCPRMNRNFFEARKLIQSQTNAPSNWEMLSISFDSDFDKPEILSSFGNFYRGNDTNRWLFAVAHTNTLAGLAPNVDLRFWREAGSISHNLRTVVLDTNGKIFSQFDGNSWTPDELATAIIKAAQQK